MSGNKNLQHARKAKSDEFYTQYQDISNEVSRYRSQFKNQVVYCNCDDPVQSNFWRYFHNNFASLGLKKLISTHYVKGSEPSYALIYEGGDDFNMSAGKAVTIHGNGEYTAGDFRSDDCLRFLDEATLVCTNPPFSLWIPYTNMLVEHQKKFLIIGNQNAITYKDVFPLIKDNKIWLGYGFKGNVAFFQSPYEDIASSSQHKEGLIRVSGVMWFTNMDVSKRHDGLWHKNGKFDQSQAHCYYEGHEDNYPKYDNYNAIEVSKTKNIPIDYPGVMGVPITWLDKYNPKEFEILGLDRYTVPKQFLVGGRVAINGKPCYARILIRNRHPISRADDKGY